MIRTIVRVAALLSTLASASASAQDFKVTLLGIGSPFPDPNRFSAATLVEAGQEKLLFGVGRGATIRLNQIGVPTALSIRFSSRIFIPITPVVCRTFGSLAGFSVITGIENHRAEGNRVAHAEGRHTHPLSRRQESDRGHCDRALRVRYPTEPSTNVTASKSLLSRLTMACSSSRLTAIALTMTADRSSFPETRGLARI
jgi:hypothetical protein